MGEIVDRDPIIRVSMFLGCSKEAAESIAPTIQHILQKVALVQIWDEDCFPPGNFVLDGLSAQASKYDFAIMLLAADDFVEIRGDRLIAARDNTVFEAGIFMAHLGRERTFILVPNLSNMRLPTDFAGLTTISYPADLTAEEIQPKLGPACREMRRQIVKLGPRQKLPDLTGGMTAVLSAFGRTTVVKHSQVTALLARYNMQHETNNIAGWEKAADYCIHHLEHMRLVEKFLGRRVGARLTAEGQRLIESPVFQRHFASLTATDRGRDVPRLLDQLFATAGSADAETATRLTVVSAERSEEPAGRGAVT